MVTSSDFDHNSFGVPLALADPQLISREETGIIVLSAPEDEIGVSFAIDVAEGDLHVILRLALLDLAVRLGLFSQQILEDGLVLSS